MGRTWSFARRLAYGFVLASLAATGPAPAATDPDDVLRGTDDAVDEMESDVIDGEHLVDDVHEPDADDEDVVPSLQDPDPRMRRRAVWHLRDLGPTADVIAALAGVLLDPDVEVRAAALDSLGRMGRGETSWPEGLEARVDTMLRDPDPGIRAAAVVAASAGPVPRDADRLATMMRVLEAAALEDTSDHVYPALGALATLGTDVVPTALEYARFASPAARHRFVELVTLAGELPVEHVDDVLSLLQDPDEWVRLRAAQAVASICQPPDRVVAALWFAASDPDWSVRAYATSPACRQAMGRASLTSVMAPPEAEPR